MEEYNTINKIYARPNESGVVIHIFSEAFEEPQPNDVCINDTNTERHGAQQYEVVDDNGNYNYQIVNGKMIDRDKSMDTVDSNNLQKIDKIKSRLNELDKDFMQGVIGYDVPDIQARKAEFDRLYTELCKLEGKEPRQKEQKFSI